MDAKRELRMRLRARRDDFVRDMDPAARRLAFGKAPSPMARLFGPDRIVAGYRAIGSEADPHHLLMEAESCGATLALPHILSRVQPMRFLSWRTEDQLHAGPLGLMQPDASASSVNPDIVIVPLVGFDRSGNRLGQGGGHYDRALSLLPNAIRIGLAWSAQEIDELPADPWDEPLSAICTEREWIVP